MDRAAIMLFIMAYGVMQGSLSQQAALDASGLINLVERFGGLAMFGIYVWWREKRLTVENGIAETRAKEAAAALAKCNDERIRQAVEFAEYVMREKA